MFFLLSVLWLFVVVCKIYDQILAKILIPSEYEMIKLHARERE